jgi:ubiquitin C-terminal hydrolase
MDKNFEELMQIINDTKRERIGFEKLYMFKSKCSLKCNSNHESITYEYRNMHILNFENYGESNVINEINFDTLLDKYIHSETNIYWNCPLSTCKKRTMKSRVITYVDEAPQIVIFYLARFKLDEDTGNYLKNTDPLHINLEGQNLSSLNIDSKEIYYDCVAIVCHIGESMTSGHYVAYTIENDQWMLYNDLTRQTVDMSEVQAKASQNSYLLIYQKTSNSKKRYRISDIENQRATENSIVIAPSAPPGEEVISELNDSFKHHVSITEIKDEIKV